MECYVNKKMDKFIGNIVNTVQDPSKVQQSIIDAQARYDERRPRGQYYNNGPRGGPRGPRRPADYYQQQMKLMIIKWTIIGIALIIGGSYLYNFAFKSSFNAEQLTQEEIDSAKRKFYAILTFYVLWALAGLAAFIWSLICFGRSGSFLEKLGGLLLSILFGPFYWIYYAFNKDYCRSKK